MSYQIEFRNAADPGEAELLVYGRIESGFWGDVPARRFVQDLAKIKARRIRVRINSVGGSLFGGLGMYNALRAHGAEIVTVVEGLAASAASIVALAGSRIVMRRGTMMMIHAPNTEVAGNANDLRAAAAVLDKARDSIVGIYEARTGRPFAELQALVDAETWMTAAQTVAEGFADAVDEEAPAALVTAHDDLLIADSLAFAVGEVPGGLRLAASLLPPVQPRAGEPEPDEEPPAEEEKPAEEPTPAAPAAPPENAPPAAAPYVGDLSPAGMLATARRTLGTDGPAVAAALLAADGLLVREALDALAPSIAAKLRAEGAAAERARLQAIDDLAFVGHDALVGEAKYGATPTDAAGLALSVAQAEKAGRAAYLRDRAADAAGVKVPAAPLPVVNADAAERERATASMVAGGNARRGGR